MDESFNKIRLLRLWEILKKETDEDHPMKTTTLIARLKAEGMTCNRATLYGDIALLNKFGYEILCNRAISNEYYVINRDFDIPEIQILIDAVQAASFITESKTPVFVDKLAQLAGSKRAAVLKKNIVEFSTIKGDNELIYYMVDEITSAITKQKKIEFYYFDLGIGKKKIYRMRTTVEGERRKYVVNPVATAFYDDKYYLLCYNDRHMTLTQYRIDRMENVRMLDEDITPNPQLKSTSVARHKRSLFDMYGGEKVEVMFEADVSVLDSIYDRFGDTVRVMPYTDNKALCRVEVQVGRPFITWLIGFGNKLKVKSPESVQQMIIDLLQEAMDNYSVLHSED